MALWEGFVIGIADRISDIAGMTTPSAEARMLRIGRHMLDEENAKCAGTRYPIIDRGGSCNNLRNAWMTAVPRGSGCRLGPRRFRGTTEWIDSMQP